jgi:hypothetical protein
LQHNWDGQGDPKYQAWNELTGPGMFKPAMSQEYFDNIDDAAKEVYDLLSDDNYLDALNMVLNYESQG